MNIQKMMKQAQKMQEQLAQAQAELAEKTVEATVVATGAGDVVSIKISPDVVDPQDVEFLEDLVLTGVKQAIEKGREMAQAEMGKLTGGMGLPPGLGL
jgi:DNA-binding YbaB/EbfC family protein